MTESNLGQSPFFQFSSDENGNDRGELKEFRLGHLYFRKQGGHFLTWPTQQLVDEKKLQDLWQRLEKIEVKKVLYDSSAKKSEAGAKTHEFDQSRIKFYEEAKVSFLFEKGELHYQFGEMNPLEENFYMKVIYRAPGEEGHESVLLAYENRDHEGVYFGGENPKRQDYQEFLKIFRSNERDFLNNHLFIKGYFPPETTFFSPQTWNYWTWSGAKVSMLDRFETFPGPPQGIPLRSEFLSETQRRFMNLKGTLLTPEQQQAFMSTLSQEKVFQTLTINYKDPNRPGNHFLYVTFWEIPSLSPERLKKNRNAKDYVVQFKNSKKLFLLKGDEGKFFVQLNVKDFWETRYFSKDESKEKCVQNLKFQMMNNKTNSKSEIHINQQKGKLRLQEKEQQIYDQTLALLNEDPPFNNLIDVAAYSSFTTDPEISQVLKKNEKSSYWEWKCPGLHLRGTKFGDHFFSFDLKRKIMRHYLLPPTMSEETTASHDKSSQTVPIKQRQDAITENDSFPFPML